MTYPAWQPGMRVTAGRLAAMMPVVFTRGSDGSTTSTSTTPVLDAVLQYPVVAGATYHVIFRLAFDRNTTDDFAVTTIWSTPAGTSNVLRHAIGPPTGDTTLSGYNRAAGLATMRGSNLTTVLHWGLHDSASDLPTTCHEESIITIGATPGVVGIAWSKAAAVAGTLFLRAQSQMSIKRIG